MVLIGAFVCVTCDESEEHLFDVVKRSAESELEAVAEIDPEEGELQIEPGQEDDRVYQVGLKRHLLTMFRIQLAVKFTNITTLKMLGLPQAKTARAIFRVEMRNPPLLLIGGRAQVV